MAVRGRGTGRPGPDSRLTRPGVTWPPGPAGWQQRVRAVIARTDRPAVTGLITLLAATGFVLARWDEWSRRNIGRFILIGQHFAHPAQLPPGMPLRAQYGYDGQFYYRLAINPLNFHHTAYGITVDQAYRFMRIGYPVITWLVSFGQRSLVPYMLVAVNVAAIGALGYLGARIAGQGGRHAAWGLLLPGYFGLVTSLCRDTAEPVAVAFLVAGLLAVRARRPSGRGLARLRRADQGNRDGGRRRHRHRPGGRPGAAAEQARAGGYRLVGARRRLRRLAGGGLRLHRDGAAGGRRRPQCGRTLHLPLRGSEVQPEPYRPDRLQRADVWLVELAVLLVFAIAALCSLRTSRRRRTSAWPWSCS